jgi:pimeloyl-ACP methyl ester carboxylesterase
MGPETRYALTADGLHIGCQIVGSGDLDLVFVPYDYSNIEASWDLNWFASFVGGLGSLARVLLFDRRGSGTSDRLGAGPSPPIEAQMDDIRAVMDAAGSKRACLFGIESGAALCLVFAATYPERTAGVVVFGGSVRGSWAPDYPWGWTDDEYGAWSDRVNREWASPKFVEFMAGWLSPTLAHHERFRASLGRLLRLSASPGDATARDRTVRDTDVRHILPTVHVPTLVIHRTHDKVEPVEEGRYIAEHIPGATFIELPGADHATSIACSQRCSSRTSSGLPNAPRSWATGHGGSCSTAITQPSGHFSAGTEERRSTTLATDSSRRSTALRGRFDVAVRSSTRSSHSVSKFGPGATRVRCSSTATRSAASPCISGRGWGRWPALPKSSCPRP